MTEPNLDEIAGLESEEYERCSDRSIERGVLLDSGTVAWLVAQAREHRGCESRYVSAVTGRRDFRAALREARTSLATVTREKAEAEARELEQAGEPELADAIREESQVEAAPVIAPPKPRAAGISTRTIWRSRVKDLRALVEAVAAGKVPLEAVKADDVVIGQAARALKKSLAWPGVEVWEETGVATR